MISNIEVIYGLANRCEPYGLKNSVSDPNFLPLKNILEHFDGIDGAENYKWNKNDLLDLKNSNSICNFSKIEITENKLDKLISALSKHSLDNGSSYLKGLYVHNEINEKIIDIYNFIRPLIKKKYNIKLGFSIYTQKEIDLILSRNVECDILQMPFNINVNLDASKLKEKGCEIYLRSIFLQGAYFANLTNKFSKSVIEKLEEQKKYLFLKAKDYNLSLGQYLFSEAISFCKFKNYKGIVIGSSSLKRIVNYFSNYKFVKIQDRNSQEISLLRHPYLSDPRKWKK